MELKVGIVEDRHDPLMLGRVRVRIIGIHTDDKGTLPTSDLPWAMVMQSPTSAAISGIGISPTGIVAGSWVVVTFMDGESCQVPLVMGTLGGVPQGGDTQEFISNVNTQPYYKIGDDDTPAPILPEDVAKSVPNAEGGGALPAPIDTKEVKAIGPLSTDDYLKLREVIAAHESSGSYSKINSKTGFLGRYQVGAAVLYENGYVKKGKFNSDLRNESAWTGKDGITNHYKFLESHEIQDAVMLKNTETNFYRLGPEHKKALRNDSPANHVAGALMAAHLVGAGGAAKYLRGEYVKADANGTTAGKYYKLGYGSLAGELPKTIPTTESALPLAQAVGETKGFADPAAKYPKRSLLQEADTNRIARAENISQTVIGVKELERIKNVRIGGTDTTWDQPHIPYAAAYPYNQVRSTEGGIIEEFDNTPNAVRYHLRHPAGTYTEIDVNGTQVNRIVGDGYQIMERDGNIIIKGTCNVTIEGAANILVQNNCNLEVYGDMNAVVKNDLNTTVHGKSSMYIQEDFSIKCKTFNVETFGGDINLLSSNNIDSKCVKDYEIEAGGKYSNKVGKTATTISTEAMSMKSGGNFSAESGATMTLQSTADTSIKVGGMLATDATDVFAQAGASIQAAHPTIDTMQDTTLRSGVALPATPPEILIKDSSGTIIRQELLDPTIAPLTPPPSRFDGIANRIEGDADDYDHSSVQALMKKAEFDPNDSDPTPEESIGSFDTSRVNAFDDTYQYENFINEENIPKGVQISPNYSLQQFLLASDGVRRVVAQHGLSEGEIVQNLHYLAVNIVEKVKAEYPEAIITSAFRPAAGASLHERGQAVDFQFAGVDKSQYYAIAKRLSEILPYDKILLEYKNFGSGMPWIHVQFRYQQNRGEVYTFFNHRKHSNGLVKLA